MSLNHGESHMRCVDLMWSSFLIAHLIYLLWYTARRNDSLHLRPSTTNIITCTRGDAPSSLGWKTTCVHHFQIDTPLYNTLVFFITCSFLSGWSKLSLLRNTLSFSFTFSFLSYLPADPPLQCPGRFLGIIGQHPSVSKSNRLHFVIFRLFFDNSRYIPQIPLKWWAILLESCTSAAYFPNSTASSVTTSRFFAPVCVRCPRRSAKNWSSVFEVVKPSLLSMLSLSI